MSKFPNSTKLVIGSETNTSTYPRLSLQTNDLAGRTVTKIDFSTANLTFSGMKAVDYFGDGSFLNTSTPAPSRPLVCTSEGNSDYVHRALRGHLPPRRGGASTAQFPEKLPVSLGSLGRGQDVHSTDYFWSPDSSDGAFDMLSRAQQFFTISDLPDSFAADPVTAQISLEKIATFDVDPEIFVVVAHDSSLMSSIPYFPAYLNDWQEGGLPVWNFLDKTNPASLLTPV